MLLRNSSFIHVSGIGINNTAILTTTFDDYTDVEMSLTQFDVSEVVDDVLQDKPVEDGSAGATGMPVVSQLPQSASQLESRLEYPG